MPKPAKKKDKDKGKARDFKAVRWPTALRQALKMAAAAHNPPMTMTEYLAECFQVIQNNGGVGSKLPTSASGAEKKQRKRFDEFGVRMFRTNDRRLIDSVLTLLDRLVT